MINTSWQPVASSLLTVTLALASAACDDEVKQIGSLDGETGETGDGDGDGDGAPNPDPDPGDGDGDPNPGESCMEDADTEEIECVPEQGVELDFEFAELPFGEKDFEFTCAANAVPSVEGYDVFLSACTNELDMPQGDLQLRLIGDWPKPALADGDEPLTEVRYVTRNAADNGYTMRAVILRPSDHSRVAVLALAGDDLLMHPDVISPLELRLDAAGCTPNPVTCSPTDSDHHYRIGFAVTEGCTTAIVADDTQIKGFHAAQNPSAYYEVLVGTAMFHHCVPGEGDVYSSTYELMFGIVGG